MVYPLAGGINLNTQGDGLMNNDYGSLTFAEAAGSYICNCHECGNTSIIDLKDEPEGELFCPICGTEQISEIDFNQLA